MATIPAAGYFSNATRTEAQTKTALEDVVASLRQVPGAGRAELTATISSGSITPAGSGGVIVVDTESAAATDDLTTIVTTNYPDGSMILLRNSNAARTVVVKHLAGGAGQLNLDQNAAYSLDDTKKWLLIQRRSADWYEVLRGPQRPLPTPNAIINGSMEIWQRGTAFAAIASGGYAADRWKREGTSAGVFTVNRSTNVPTVAQAGVLFNYSLEVDVTTADSSVASGDGEAIVQRIEGYNFRPLAQKQFTLSFWVMSSKTGTHCVSFRNTGDDRSYVATYTVNSVDTWEWKVVTVEASPSAGTWNYVNGTGLVVGFSLMAGTTFQTTAGSWQTGLFQSTSAQVNVLDNTANFFRLTGVKIEEGPIATPLAPIDVALELNRCQRYCQKSFPYATAPAQNSGINDGASSVMATGASISISCNTPFATAMRTAPTITTYNPSAANAQARNASDGADCSSMAVFWASDRGFTITTTTNAAGGVNDYVHFHWLASAEL